MKNIPAVDTDACITGFPEETQILLQEVRTTIQKSAPKAKEVISHGMPAFKFYTVLIYFAGYNHHIGFYPTSSDIWIFQDEIATYKNSKEAVQFPLDKNLPLSLIAKIVRFKMKEDIEKATDNVSK
ncbi:hypothetical protein EMGBS15_15760 [Filimonas sp.]|jgi:hypothetical protein|nr:hypothetical protein EMGBS15_15760 [Filimonas sp.]